MGIYGFEEALGVDSEVCDMNEVKNAIKFGGSAERIRGLFKSQKIASHVRAQACQALWTRDRETGPILIFRSPPPMTPMLCSMTAPSTGYKKDSQQRFSSHGIKLAQCRLHFVPSSPRSESGSAAVDATVAMPSASMIN